MVKQLQGGDAGVVGIYLTTILPKTMQLLHAMALWSLSPGESINETGGWEGMEMNREQRMGNGERITGSIRSVDSKIRNS